MTRFDIYIAGVGGQGIGLLSETLVRAVDHSGTKVRAVDTHGLAQRGGMVVSHVRLGSVPGSPLVRRHRVDLVVALERHEACRAGRDFLRPGGALVYYDTSWQPLSVRLALEEAITSEDVERVCELRRGRLLRVQDEKLQDSRMQNVVIMGRLCREKLVPGLEPEHYRQALRDLLDGDLLENNLSVFKRALKRPL